MGETINKLLKICLITGPLEPGKCGITDYVELLALEFEKFGHKVKKLEIKSFKDFVYHSKGMPEADFYSLQFAPFLFSTKGLSGKALYTFGYMLKQYETHINFHEIWTGAYPQASLKEKLVGWRQKREILQFLKITNPAFITTSNSAALDRLKRQGIATKYLYLFGNIPQFREEQSYNTQLIKVVFFGTLYDKFPYEQLAENLDKISKLTDKSIELSLVGRKREGIGLRQVRSIAIRYGFSFSEKGELPIQLISKELHSSDIGVATTPFDVIGKSGATAAMLEHRLPVLVYDDGDTPKKSLYVIEEFRDQLFLLNDASSIDDLHNFMLKARKNCFVGVAHTANKMLEMVA